MPSVIDICNSALDKLGQTPIMSLTDGTKSAKLCNRNWPLARDKVLRDHPWNFAVARTILAPTTVEPVWGFGSRFPLPTDLLRLIEVRDYVAGEYQVEGESILANGSALYIRYVKRVEDPNAYDALFCDSVALALAADMCEALTQSSTKEQVLAEKYRDSITRAKSADAQENPPTSFQEDEWLIARY